VKQKLPKVPSDAEINDKLKKIEDGLVSGHISFKELIKDIPVSDVSHEKQINLEILLERINKVRDAWGKPMVVTSGLRTEQDQLRIYRARGVADEHIPMGSWHIKGGAVDILDRDWSLMEWVRENESLMAEIGLWMEDDNSQPRVHFQIAPPKSGHRFFKP
jgi:uncharacterized protein YcbK (DUF882 family)